MAVYRDLEERIPRSCRDLLNLSEDELKSEIPALARDKSRMNEVDKAVRSLPTHHHVYLRDSSDMRVLDDEGVHLIVTSPPYFNIKEYENGGEEEQLGDIDDYDTFNDLLNEVWKNCYDKLVPGGRLCIVVGDVLQSRSDHGRHRVIPLHSTIQEKCRNIGFDNLSPIIWYKIGNATLEAGGNARFLGKPYEPGAVVKNDVEYILLLRKPGGYRSPNIEERILSTIEADQHQKMFRQLWDDIGGEPQTHHPAPYPAALAERLIRMFSFVGDTIMDPFAGSGSTAVAASRAGRNTVNFEIEPEYVDIIENRLNDERASLDNYDNMTISINR